MTDEKQTITGSEICTIRIMFPVTSDTEALASKRKIDEIFKETSQVRLEFSIMSIPGGGLPNAR